MSEYIPTLLSVAEDLLALVEETLPPEFFEIDDLEQCARDNLCQECRPVGCIAMKIRLAKAAIAKATNDKSDLMQDMAKRLETP